MDYLAALALALWVWWVLHSSFIKKQHKKSRRIVIYLDDVSSVLGCAIARELEDRDFAVLTTDEGFHHFPWRQRQSHELVTSSVLAQIRVDVAIRVQDRTAKPLSSRFGQFKVRASASRGNKKKFKCLSSQVLTGPVVSCDLEKTNTRRGNVSHSDAAIAAREVVDAALVRSSRIAFG